MKWNPRLLRTVVLWIALFVAAAVTGGVALLESGILTPVIVEEVNDHLAPAGLALEATSLYWRPWSGLTLGNVVIWGRLRAEEGAEGVGDPRADPRRRRLILAVDQLEVRYKLLNLLSTRTAVDRIKVVRPTVDLTAFRAWRERGERGDVAADTTAGEPPPLAFPRFRVDDLRLQGGRILQGSDLDLSGLRLVGSLEGTPSALVMQVETAGTRIRTRRIDETVELTGDLTIADDGIELPGLHFTAAGGRVSLAGHWDPWSRRESVVQVTGYSIPLAKVGEWIGLAHPLLQSNLEFSLLASGRPDSLRLSGEMSGMAEDGVQREIQLTGTRDRDRLHVESLHVRAGNSLLDLEGEFTLEATPHVRGVAVFRDLNPAEALAEPDLAGVQGVDGALRFDGVGLTRDTFTGDARLEVSRGSLFGFDVDRGSAQMRLEDGELTLVGATVGRGESEISGEGTISADNVVDAKLKGTVVDLADLGSAALADAGLAGQASIELLVRGPIAGPAFDAVLRFDETSVMGARVGRLDLAVGSQRVGTGGEIAVRVTAEDLGFRGNVIPRGLAEGVVQAGVVTVRHLELTSERRGQLRLSGDVAFEPDGRASGRVTRLEIRSPDGDTLWSNEGAMVVARTAESLTVDGVDLRGPGGSVTGNLTLNREGESFVQASGAAVDLAAFSPYLLLPKPLAGTLDFRVDGSFSREAIGGVVAVDLRDGTWGDDTLERLQGNVTVHDDVAEFDEVQLVSSFATASLTGRLALPGGSFARVVADSAARASLLDRLVFEDFRAKLDSPDFDWFWDLLPNVPRAAGRGSFTARIDGPLVAPIADVRAEVGNGELGTHRLDAIAATAHFDGSDLHVKDGVLRSGNGILRFDGRVPFQWSFTHPVPSIPGDRDVDLQLKGTRFPVGTLAPIIPLFEAIDGFADTELRFLGQAGTLYFDGAFTVQRATFAIPTFVDPLVNGIVLGAFGPEGLTISSARFEDGAGGVVAAEGTLTLDNLSARDWRFDIRAEDYHYGGTINGIRGVGTGGVVLIPHRTEDDRLIPRFEGSFDVRRADLDERALVPPDAASVRPEMPAGVNAPDEVAPDALEDKPGVVPIYAEIRLRGDRNLWVRTPEMDVEGAGDVVLHVTPEYAGLVGEVHTLRGTYSVLNSRFNVEQSSVKFVDPEQPMQALIDAEATTRVLDEDVTVLVSGTVELPVIELSTKSGMSEAEIYELLALRIKRSPDGTATDGILNDAFQRSYLAAVTNRFGGELSRELGFDMFDFDAGDRVEGSSVTVGKSLGRDFFLKYRQAVGALAGEQVLDATRESQESPERALTLEYRLSDIFTLQGETGTLKIGEDYLNVDLKLEWGY